jgi:hypothetical protein
LGKKGLIFLSFCCVVFSFSNSIIEKYCMNWKSLISIYIRLLPYYFEKWKEYVKNSLISIILVQAFLKKWWVESDFKAPNLPLSLRFKGSGCHYKWEIFQEYHPPTSHFLIHAHTYIHSFILKYMYHNSRYNQ